MTRTMEPFCIYPLRIINTVYPMIDTTFFSSWGLICSFVASISARKNILKRFHRFRVAPGVAVQRRVPKGLKLKAIIL